MIPKSIKVVDERNAVPMPDKTAYEHFSHAAATCDVTFLNPSICQRLLKQLQAKSWR